MLFRHLLTALVLLVFVSYANAELVNIKLADTGAGNAAQGQGNGNVMDNSWRAGYLGAHGIGFENGGSYDGPKADMNNLIQSAKNADMTSAFIYDNAQFPVSSGAYGAVPDGTGWIGSVAQFDPNGPQGYATHTAGYYAYELDFGIAANEAGTYKLFGSLAVDNALIGILLDGTLLYNAQDATGDWQNGFSIEDFYSDDFMLTAGDHTLTFLTSNYGNEANVGNPAAFWGQNILLQQQAAAATPEPATLLIFGVGLAGLGLAARRKLQK